MKNVISTISITGFVISLVGLSLTKESARTLPDITDMRRLRPAASGPPPAFALSLPKPIHISLEVRKDGPKRQERKKGQYDEDEDAPHQHEGEGEALGLQAARGAAPLPPHHRPREREHQPYWGVSPDEDDRGRREVEEQGVRG